MTRMAVVLLVMGMIDLGACGGDAAAPSTTGEATTAAPPTTAAITTAAPALTPAGLGDQIGEVYLAAYDDLIALLADRPAAADLAADLADLKEKYVQEMVGLGRQREALPAAGRAAVDARITAALDRLPRATYEAYQQAYSDYSGETEVANLIAAFNIIGQYANFDLLRQQAPDEAERLGVG
ncbi:MAG: hypothetical protein ABIJ48_10365 [Actinomycetota bacterium]